MDIPIFFFFFLLQLSSDEIKTSRLKIKTFLLELFGRFSSDLDSVQRNCKGQGKSGKPE